MVLDNPGRTGAVEKSPMVSIKNCRRSQEHCYDREAALEEVKDYMKNLPSKQDFNPQELKYIIRKFEFSFKELGFENVEKLFQTIRNGFSQQQNDKMLNDFVITLKYLVNNNEEGENPLQITYIVEILKNDSTKGKATHSLISLLMLCYDKTQNDDQELLESILQLPSLDNQTRSYFHGKSNMNLDHDFEEMKSITMPKVKRGQQFVSKTIQTVKSKTETKTSEEIALKMLNISDRMKNRKKMATTQNVRKDLSEPETSMDGSDR